MRKENKRINYSFRKVEHPKMLANDRMLVCPACREVLMRADIEGFSACPFCSYKFESSYELEDFIMEPLVDSWVRHQPGFSFQVLSSAPSSSGNE